MAYEWNVVLKALGCFSEYSYEGSVNARFRDEQVTHVSLSLVNSPTLPKPPSRGYNRRC